MPPSPGTMSLLTRAAGSWTAGGTTVINSTGAGNLSTGDADVTLDLPAPLGQVEVRSVAGQVAGSDEVGQIGDGPVVARLDEEVVQQ